MRRFRKKTQAIAVAAQLLASAAALATPTTIGNGGDPLTQLFVDGKRHALRMLQDSSSSDASDPARKWLRQNRQALARDLEATQIRLVDSFPPGECPAQTCACTRREPAALVQLSIPRCSAAVASVSTAGRLLLHETVHHFGIADEAFADDVASAVYRCNLSGAKSLKRVTVRGENWPGNAIDPGGADFDDYRVVIAGDLAVNDLQLYAEHAQDLMIGYSEGTPGTTTQSVVLRIVGCDDEVLKSYEVSSSPVNRIPVRKGDRIHVQTVAKTGADTRTYELDYDPTESLQPRAFRVIFE